MIWQAKPNDSFFKRLVAAIQFYLEVRRNRKEK